jgi:tetratricopeptide (TPR) repeat protein
LKDYSSVEKLYQLFEESQIAKKEIWFEIAYSLNELKQQEAAKQAYLMYIKEEGESSASLNNLALIFESEEKLQEAIELYKKALEINSNDDIVKRNLNRVTNDFEKKEQEMNQRKIWDSAFKSALKTLKIENNFVIEKLSKFIFNLKIEKNFCDWKIAIQEYKFPKLMETDKQKAESLREQWIKKEYIKKTDCRDEHNVMIYLINPYIEAEITKINNNT